MRIIPKFKSSFKLKIKAALGKDEKIFIIGKNKTGTTSLKEVFKSLGYIVGNQAKAELLIDEYEREDFDSILDYCDTAEVFQDIPFSMPDTYKHLYKKYPNAKYILLERESPEIWFNSLLRFHQKLVNNGNPITANDLKNFEYRKKGFLWQSAQIVYGIDETTLYDKDTYIQKYNSYNQEVKEFFKDKNNFLSLVLSHQDTAEKLAVFLDRKVADIKIPHLNKSS
ncbi:hypothetical protein DS885_09910 [Psychromonas sp. B3M02]|uniref:sulfotransferase n=1 Tax=Psychromonas sp. B3M02 TaxID=2267226 RepID=UPI000DEA66B7|nr:sulfotransferase [Psychromonas sp. B3M02]RBW45599.1 hypothetical protein DS885_09910 [Psychromonas sp. B3M02]